MYRPNRYIFFCLLLPAFVLLWNSAIGQDFKFHALRSENILENQSILSIDQDNEGRLWFGGKEKLYVYDSRSIKNIFEHDSTFLGGEYLNKIAIDAHDNIFLGTAYSLLIYNLSQRKYTVPKSHSLINAQINDIKLWQGKAFVASSKGLYVIAFDKKQNKYVVEQQITNLNTQTLGFIDEQTLAYASAQQVSIVPSTFTKNTKQGPQIQITLPVTADFITAIYGHDGRIWIGTHDSGVFVYEQNRLIKKIDEHNSTLLSNNIRKITKINDMILVGTLKGLTTIDPSGRITNFTHEINIPWSISQNSIYDIYQDDQNILWIGTYFGGINAIYPNSSPISTLSSQSTSKYRLQSDIVSSIVEDGDRLYVGTEESGLQIIDKTSGNSKNIPTASNLVKDLFLHDNKLYIGQHIGGLSILDLHTGKLQNNMLSKQKASRANNVNTVTVDIHGNIFLGTDNGIFQWDNNEEFFFEETKGVVINQILDNKADGVYTIFRGRLWLKKYKQREFEHIETPLIKDRIQSFFLGKNGDIWLSTNHHIYLLNNHIVTPIYENIDVEFGNILYLDNHLWICSSNGLLRYNLNTKQLYTLTNEDGLTANFLQNSTFYLNDNDKVYVTSLKGINTFNPQEIKFNGQTPTVLFSKFSVFDEEVLLKKKEDKDGLPYHIRLPYDQNYFSIEFASSNFIKPQKNKYKYKLEGFDKDWKQTAYPVARYMNIEPGEYTLWMMASNNDGVWAEKPLGIHIRIAPPFWKTWWAYLLYAVIIFALLHFGIKFIVERQLLINSEKEHEEKIKFFTHVSHEIRTPLTLISIPLREIVHETANNPALNGKIKKLQRNADNLLNLVNELLDFRKIDVGKKKLNLSQIDLKDYVEDFFYLFTDYAMTKNLTFFTKRMDNVGLAYIDTQQFDKVLNNLLSNAIKYSKQNGTVFIELIAKNKDIILRIADNGIGVSNTNQFKIFEEYYREEKNQTTLGTGIGLALTKEIVEKHHGEISCATEQIEAERFTIFSIRLKNAIKRESVSEQEEIPHKTGVVQEPNPALANNTKKNILIVEDNEEMSEIIQNILAPHYNLSVAYNGAEGYAIALKQLPDLIISDVMMPEVDGPTMCQNLKTNEITSHIPIILLTADTNETTQLKGLENGANIYLTKPFNPTTVIYSIKNLLDIADNSRKEFKIDRPSQQMTKIDREFLTKVENIIDSNLTNDQFNVEFLAREIGISQPILYKKLHAVTNLSVNNFIKQYRFKKAIRLLESDKNVSEVAYAVGFNDRKYFSKEFKKKFGANPSEYVRLPRD